MYFCVNLVFWCVLVITTHCQPEEECVQRRLGSCIVLPPYTALDIDSSRFKYGLPFKMSMEFNLLENKYSFEKKVPVEKKRKVTYNLENAALVTIKIFLNVGVIAIDLGKKHYRLAELKYVNEKRNFSEIKYNRYTPHLPTFPYNLHLEITTSGTFSIYADGNTEPFFEYQVTNVFRLKSIGYITEGDNSDIIAFSDCSEKNKPYCGTHRIDKLYGCREWMVSGLYEINNLQEFRKTYGKDVLFDEFIVVDSVNFKMRFFYENYGLQIVFKVDSIEVTLGEQNGIYLKERKSVRTKQWHEVPASPYAVRVLLTTGENNTFLKITNLRNDSIISMNLCEDIGSFTFLLLEGARLYFDCLTSDSSDNNITISERPRKIIQDKTRQDEGNPPEYHKYGYNYTKMFLDTSDYVSKPVIKYEFGNSTQDWCPGENQPELLVTSKCDYDSLEGLIERSNRELLSKLEKINAQNNASAEILLTELKVISDVLATHLDRNTSVNYNYNNYYNQVNVSEFLKFLKQN